MTFRRGRRLGIDVGSVRVGIAQCDPDGILATPLDTVYRRDGDETALRRIRAIAEEYEPLEIIGGLPASLDGTERASAQVALDFTRRIAEVTGVPVRLHDERFTTTQAHRVLQSVGKNARKRREIVDSVAAVVILQAAIDQEKQTGVPGGRMLDDVPTTPTTGGVPE
ncbi:Holliday junction resolvase RuvX [Brevibacterium samyangense]|uniref:Putative pre-16S rRNA nuclease n=1 Tax=Brevibacterium samyangense TaxID=366888 RepID=A0ABN2TGF2_9MICO